MGGATVATMITWNLGQQISQAEGYSISGGNSGCPVRPLERTYSKTIWITNTSSPYTFSNNPDSGNIWLPGTTGRPPLNMTPPPAGSVYPDPASAGAFESLPEDSGTDIRSCPEATSVEQTFNVVQVQRNFSGGIQYGYKAVMKRNWIYP